MIIKSNRTLRFPVLSKKYSPTDTLSNLVRGCNLSFWKQDFININGYDESFEGWGYDDSEIITRMMNNGVSALKINNIAILFHLYHKEEPRDREDC